MKWVLIIIAILIAHPVHAEITSGDGFVHLYPCAVQSQQCIRIVIDSGVNNISNIWLLQGDAQSQQHGATYPAEWGDNSPKDVEVTSRSDSKTFSAPYAPLETV